MSNGYMYHLLPSNLEGHSLIPLNDMDKSGKLFELHSRKYEGREELMRVTIPILNCLWNDVVQFSAIHPQIIADHLMTIQADLKINRLKVLRIPLKLAQEKYHAVVFHSRANKKKGDYSIHENEVFKLGENFFEIDEIPQATFDFWEMSKRGEAPFLWFPYVPHIFIKGAVDLADGEVIELKSIN